MFDMECVELDILAGVTARRKCLLGSWTMGPGLWRGLKSRDSDLKATCMSLKMKFVAVEELTNWKWYLLGNAYILRIWVEKWFSFWLVGKGERSLEKKSDIL